MLMSKYGLIGRFFQWISTVFTSGCIYDFITSKPLEAGYKNSFVFKSFEKVQSFKERIIGNISKWIRPKVESSVIISTLQTILMYFLSFNTRFYGSIGLVVGITSLAGGFHIIKIALILVSVLLMVINFTPALHYKEFIITKVFERIFGEEIDVGDFKFETKSKTAYGLGVILGILASGLYLINPLLAPLFLVGIFGFLLIMKYYQVGVFALVFVAPIVPTMLCAAIGVLTFVSFAVKILVDGKLPFKLDATTFLIFLLVLVFGFFTLTSLTLVGSLKIFVLYMAFMLNFFTVYSMITNKKQLYWLVATFVVSGFIVALYGIFQEIFGTGNATTWVDEEMFGSMARVYSTLENPNVLGEFLLLLIPLSVALMWTREIFISKLFYFGVTATAVLCMVFTQSRGCWIGLFVTVAIFVLFKERRLIPVAVIFAMLLPFVLPDSIIERFSSIGNMGDSSTSYRVFIWLGTFAMLKDFGLFGLGLGISTFNKVYPFYSYSGIIAPHSHNLYLQLLTETGIIGLVLVLTIAFTTFKRNIYTFMKNKKDIVGMVSLCVFAGMAGFFVQGAFDYVWYNYRIFLVFWLVLAIGMSAYKVRCIDEK